MKIIKQVSTRIEISDQQTTYIVGYDLLDNLSKLECFKIPDIDNILLLTDQNVFGLYGKRILDSLNKSGKKMVKVIVPAGEKSKSLATVESVCKTFMENKANRKSILVTLGGGVITDLGGFIGSVLLRGIRVIHLPTTLLAQIDAAIGGKSAVDVIVSGKMLKNMIGKIEQPFAVISDVSLLSSLPKKEVINGLGEMIKYWAGWGEPSIKQLLAIKTPGRWPKDSFQVEELAKIISTCQQIKIDIVRKDPFETLGLREKLNLGHTIGHAVEGEAKGKLSHGQCVALGLVGVVKISTRMRLLNQKAAEQILDMIKDLCLPTSASGVNIEKVMSLMHYDKKGGNFVLIKDIGDLITSVKVESKLIKEVLSEIIN